MKEFRQDISQFREELNSEQAAWQNKTEGEMDMVNDNVRLEEERFARLVENRVTDIQAALQNSIQNVNTEIKNLWEQLAARQLTASVIPSQVLSVTAVDVENNSQSI